MRFNPPPGWPVPPQGFVPEPGWQPDPSWPPAPPGWQLWLPGEEGSAAGSPGWTMPPWSPPVAPPPSGTNGMAVASLVLGLLGFLFAGLCAILGIVFGIVAIRAIRRTGQHGKGLAIAGIVLGSVWLVVVVVVIAVLVATSSPGSATAPPVSPSSAPPGAGSNTVNPLSLVKGDCFDNPTPTAGQGQSLTSVVQTRCDQPHNAQIFATFNVSGSLLNYPGVAKLRSMAGTGCAARSSTSLDRAKVTDSMSIRFLYPQQLAWLGGRRTISCIVYSAAPLTSSVLTS